MKKYYAYTRVSTVKQGTKGVSLQEQKSAIEIYAQRHGLQISEWFEERVTAAKTGRALFSQIMKGLQNGDADGLIIHKIDRSARNLKDWAMLGELIDVGVDVQITSENYDLNSRGGRLSADIQAVIAADYIRNLREETLKGMRGRLKQGLYPLKAPVGYIDNGQGQVKTIDPIQGPLVKLAFELYASRKLSIRMLAVEMHNRGLRSGRGGTLGKNGMSRILNNPFYYGTIKIKTTGETYSGIHSPLISKSLFNRVQHILAGKYIVKTCVHDFSYKRTFKCAGCGYSLIGEKQKGRVYYRCQTKLCEMKTIREDVLVDMIDEVLSTIDFGQNLISGLALALVETQHHSADLQKTTIETQSLQLANAKSKANRLMDLYIEGKITDDIFTPKQDALNTEISELEERTKNADGHIGQILNSVEQFLELTETLISSYKTAPEEYRGELLKSVTSNPTVSPTGVDIPIDLPWSLFACAESGTFSGPRRDKPRTSRKQIRKILGALILYFQQENNADVQKLKKVKP